LLGEDKCRTFDPTELEAGEWSCGLRRSSTDRKLRFKNGQCIDTATGESVPYAITPMPEEAEGANSQNQVILEIRGLGYASDSFHMSGRSELGPHFCQCWAHETDYVLSPIPIERTTLPEKRKATDPIDERSR